MRFYNDPILITVLFKWDPITDVCYYYWYIDIGEADKEKSCQSKSRIEECKNPLFCHYHAFHCAVTTVGNAITMH